MKLIELSKRSKNHKGKYFAQVDDEDFEYLNQFHWQACKHGCTHYARRVDKTNKGVRIYMHREVMKANELQSVDHKFGNGLDNQRSNLRFCTQSQNVANKRPNKNGTSKYLGVCFHRQGKKWVAQMDSNKKHIHIRLFKTEENAAIAYNIFAEKHHGEFARYNTAAA